MGETILIGVIALFVVVVDVIGIMLIMSIKDKGEDN